MPRVTPCGGHVVRQDLHAGTADLQRPAALHCPAHALQNTAPWDRSKAPCGPLGLEQANNPPCWRARRYDLLTLFQTGRSHMVVLTAPPAASLSRPRTPPASLDGAGAHAPADSAEEGVAASIQELKAASTPPRRCPCRLSWQCTLGLICLCAVYFTYKYVCLPLKLHCSLPF